MQYTREERVGFKKDTDIHVQECGILASPSDWLATKVTKKLGFCCVFYLLSDWKLSCNRYMRDYIDRVQTKSLAVMLNVSCCIN